MYKSMKKTTTTLGGEHWTAFNPTAAGGKDPVSTSTTLLRGSDPQEEIRTAALCKKRKKKPTTVHFSQEKKINFVLRLQVTANK